MPVCSDQRVISTTVADQRSAGADRRSDAETASDLRNPPECRLATSRIGHLLVLLCVALFPSVGRCQISPMVGPARTVTGRPPEVPRAELVGRGSSSRRTRKRALQELPLESLPSDSRRQADEILDSLSVFRRLSAYRFEVDPRVHDFFIEHPDVAVSIWRTMGISTLQMSRIGPDKYTVKTADGTVGTITALQRSRESNLILCRGSLKSPYIAKPVEARALMHLHSHFSKDAQGRSLVTYQADLFVSFPAHGVETVAKLVSPVSNIILDRNFEEISLFLHVMWLAMNHQPGWVEQIASRLQGILPATSEELLKLTAQIYVDGQTHRLRRSGQPVSLQVVRPPVRSAERR